VELYFYSPIHHNLYFNFQINIPAYLRFEVLGAVNVDIIIFGNMTQFDRNVSTFPKNMLPPSSGLTFQNSYLHIGEGSGNVFANLTRKWG